MGRISAAIDACLAQDADRYHTPGHKGTLCARDITELGISGKLFPSDAIVQAEQDTAALYGVAHLRYLTGGSSMGIKAALQCFRGQKVLYASGAHRAFREGCELAGIHAVPVLPQDKPTHNGLVYTCGCNDLPAPLNLSDAQKALDTHRDAKALFLTSPDYLGRVTDIRIAALCHERGVALIADAAHGAHFAFAPDLADVRMETVADFANMSVHKTLGAYTQSAVLAVNNAAFVPQVAHALELLGTTSPNYPMLAQIEDSVLAASEHKKEYARLQAFVRSLAKDINVLQSHDYTRLCVLPQKGNAEELFASLTAKGIMPEAIINGYVVFILTPYDDDEKLARLQRVLRETVR